MNCKNSRSKFVLIFVDSIHRIAPLPFLFLDLDTLSHEISATKSFHRLLHFYENGFEMNICLVLMGNSEVLVSLP